VTKGNCKPFKKPRSTSLQLLCSSKQDLLCKVQERNHQRVLFPSNGNEREPKTLFIVFKSGHMTTDTVTYDAIQLLARNLGSLLTASPPCLISQHIKCVTNVVLDILSYTGSAHGKPHPMAVDNRSNQELTQHFHDSLSSQIPPNFDISPLPNNILSWVMQVLQTVESYLTQSKKLATKPLIVSGTGGNTSASAVSWMITLSSLTKME